VSEPRATFDGKYFHIKEAMLEPKPVQKPHPPILIGGSGEQLTLRAVARWGDACNVFGDPEWSGKNMPSCEALRGGGTRLQFDSTNESDRVAGGEERIRTSSQETAHAIA